MTPKAKEWIEDLETTTANQGHGFLHRADGIGAYSADAFCCMGRACEVLEIPSKLEQGRYIYGERFTAFISEEPILAHLGIGLQEQQGLVYLNDGFGQYNADGVFADLYQPHTFKQIAQILRAWLPPEIQNG